MPATVEIQGESDTDLRLQVQQLKAELKAEQMKTVASLSLKVSGKSGVISLYGLQKMPISLYRTGWAAMSAKIADVLTMCEEQSVHLDHIANLAKEWKGYKGPKEKEWITPELADRVAVRINTYMTDNLPAGTFKVCPKSTD